MATFVSQQQPQATSWHPSKNHSEFERWICIYPAFINSKKTRQEGRRLPKKYCVENPTYHEIRDVLSVTGLHIGVENKQYSRENSRELQYRGRIRVQTRNDDGTFCHPDFTSRQAIMSYVGKTIPQLKSRQTKVANDAYQHIQKTAGSSVSGKKSKNKRR